jgi:hypothetical protein
MCRHATATHLAERIAERTGLVVIEEIEGVITPLAFHALGHKALICVPGRRFGRARDDAIVGRLLAVMIGGGALSEEECADLWATLLERVVRVGGAVAAVLAAALVAC